MSSAQQQASSASSNGSRAISWLRALGVICGAPKTLLPYVLPWLLGSLTLAFCYLVVQGVLRQQLLVPPVETPPSLAERGYTSSFLAERIMSEMRVIGRDAGSIPHDALTVSEAQPDIQIPGQDLSYATTVRFLKDVVDRKDVVVHIGITKLDDAADSYVAHVQIEGGVFRSRQGEVPFAGRDMDRFVRDIAAQAMRLAEPNILASHLFTEVQKTKCSLAQCNYGEIVGIYDEVLALPASKQSEWAEAGKAWLLVSQGPRERGGSAEPRCAAPLRGLGDPAGQPRHCTRAAAPNRRRPGATQGGCQEIIENRREPAAAWRRVAARASLSGGAEGFRGGRPHAPGLGLHAARLG